MAPQRHAGEAILDFVNTHLGEALLEGTSMGLLATASALTTPGNDPRNTALQLTSSIAGTVGAGFLGRSGGAAIDAMLHRNGGKLRHTWQTVGRIAGDATGAWGGAQMGNLLSRQLGWSPSTPEQASQTPMG